MWRGLEIYKNLSFKESWNQAEVGGLPRLRLWPVIFKRPSADAAAQLLYKWDLEGLVA